MAGEFLTNLASYRTVVVNYRTFFDTRTTEPQTRLATEQVLGVPKVYTVPGDLD